MMEEVRMLSGFWAATQSRRAENGAHHRQLLQSRGLWVSYKHVDWRYLLHLSSSWIETRQLCMGNTEVKNWQGVVNTKPYMQKYFKLRSLLSYSSLKPRFLRSAVDTHDCQRIPRLPTQFSYGAKFQIE